MKLIDLLVQELPKRGGWPDCVDSIHQDHDGEIYAWTGSSCKLLFRTGIIADNCRPYGLDESIENMVTRNQYESALALSQKPAWSGEGLPPVGCRVEYTCKNPDIGHPSIEPGRWYGGVIIAYYNECVWTSDNGVRHLSNTIFRPMRSKPDQKRYDAIESLFEILDAGVSASQDSIDIYDAIAAGKIPGVKLDD